LYRALFAELDVAGYEFFPALERMITIVTGVVNRAPESSIVGPHPWNFHVSIPV
jgi:hypothetical protein